MQVGELIEQCVYCCLEVGNLLLIIALSGWVKVIYVCHLVRSSGFYSIG